MAVKARRKPDAAACAYIGALRCATCRAYNAAHHPAVPPQARVNPRPKKLHLLRWLPDRLMLTTCRSHDRALYLSFDDGPHPQHTPRLLDLLAEHDARASFFLVGTEVEKYPAIVRRMAAEGHLVGNHSYSHPPFPKITLAEQLHEIDRTDRLLAEIDGCAQHAFRPPSGALPLPLLLHFARQRRRIVYWSYDSLDYQRRPTPEFVAILRRAPPQSGDIVLMHDDDANVVDSLKELLPEWRTAGFAFHALPPEKMRAPASIFGTLPHA
jgi:peptidoglycan/xylan/chitin deacetylase (PgdA/CDA1 family)